MRCWRISLARFAERAFDGQGSTRYAARWHEKGTAVVYTSGALSLAALEFFVNWNLRSAPEPLVAIQVEVPADLKVDAIELRELPAGWRGYPAPLGTQQMGTRWVQSSASAVLRVPSVIIPREQNYLLNPGHKDWKKIHIGKPEPFSFDPRMWK
jgi:RES domain-containing protein